MRVNAFGNALGNSIVGAIKATPAEGRVEVPESVSNLGQEADQAYRQKIVEGGSADAAFDAATSAAGSASGITTYALGADFDTTIMPRAIYINTNGIGQGDPSLADYLADGRTSLNDYYSSVQDNAVADGNFFKYAGAGALKFLGNAGYGLAQTADAIASDPGSTLVGATKAVGNFGPESFNGLTNLAKTSLDGLSLIAESTVAPNGFFSGFRDSDAYNIGLLSPYSNAAEMGGAALANLGIGAGLTKLGGYGISIEDVGLSGPRLAQGGAINLRLYSPETQAKILEAFQQGNDFEARARSAAGFNKNYERIYDAERNYAVPDALSGNRIVEFKDQVSISKDAQFQIYEQADSPIDLIISPRTQVMSDPLLQLVQKSGGSLSIFDPGSNAFYPYDFRSGTYLIGR